ncbi:MULTISPECIES: hypothetical protein [Bradyrhizobium]|uniref:hypothetical protein n=1 Tax=Bradyrhizobium TaxID=374 RepID=UPI00041800C7|nr:MULTISPECIES: hypothetical protein [Bradyrhizobium]WLB90523.1 hypothetical protein QIH91_08615 [Bradyrhizobium japonicum USDA 135]GLR92638.1 hypothetical protein GCM10007858_02580 [Bradyrhizobium liaoningense]
MLDEYLARIRAHRKNIHRYRRLLKSNLSDVERQFIEKRLTEEQTALEFLSAETFPLAFSLRKGRTCRQTSRGAANDARVPGGLIRGAVGPHG